jgi:hypothetical protein
MEYSWKIEHVDDVNNTMTVQYTFNTSYPMDPVLVNMSRVPAGVNVNDHIKMHAPTHVLAPGAKYNNSASTGLSGMDAVYVDAIVKMDTISLEDYKKLKLEEIAAKRYEFEVSGLTIGDTMIDTSRTSQAILTAAYISLKNNLISSVDWKGRDGVFVTLDLATVEMLSTAVSTHVQTAFTKEKNLTILVAAATTKSEVDAIVW